MHKHIQTVQFANAQTHTYRSWSGNISYYPQNIPHILFSHEYIYTNIVYIIIYIRSLSATHTNVYTRPDHTHHPSHKQIYFIYLYSIDFLQLPYLSQAIYLLGDDKNSKFRLHALIFFFLAGQSTVSSVPGGQGQMSTSGSSSLPTSAVIGAAIGGIFVLILIIAIVCFARRKKSRYET